MASCGSRVLSSFQHFSLFILKIENKNKQTNKQTNKEIKLSYLSSLDLGSFDFIYRELLKEIWPQNCRVSVHSEYIGGKFDTREELFNRPS